MYFRYAIHYLCVLRVYQLEIKVKSFTPFNISKQFNFNEQSLSDFLTKNQFVHCGPTDTRSMGFIDPVDDSEEIIVINGTQEDQLDVNNDAGEDQASNARIVDTKKLYRNINGVYHFMMKIEKKAVPSSAVKQELKQREVKYAKEIGFVPGRKWKKEEKEKIVSELLPKAFPTTSTVSFYVDVKNGLLIVGSVSGAMSENLATLMRKNFEDMAPTYCRLKQSPSVILTSWISSGEPPSDFTIDMDGQLKNEQTGGSIKIATQNMAAAEVCNHIQQNYAVESIALTYDSKLSFIATSKFTFKKLKWCAIKEQEVHEGKEEEFAAQKTMESADIAAMVSSLLDSYGGLLVDTPVDQERSNTGQDQIILQAA